MINYQKLTNDQIIDAVCFFPELANQEDIKNKLTSTLKSAIKIKKASIAKQGNKLHLKSTIDQYFDLDKYKPLKYIEMLDWITQFIIRKSILDNLKAPSQTNTDKYLLQQDIFQIMLNPIAESRNKLPLYIDNQSSVNDLIISELSDLSAKYTKDGTFKYIEDTVIFLNAPHKTIPPDDEKTTKAHSFLPPVDTNKVPDDELMTVLHQFAHVVNTPVDTKSLSLTNPHLITPTIDLNANDDQLKKDFSIYLSQKRKELNIKPLTPKPLKKGKIGSLITHRVLQYLDVIILDLYINGKKTLSNNEVGKIIFPGSDPTSTSADVTEKIRKSTAPTAQEMTNDRVIDSTLMKLQKKRFRLNL